MGGQHLFQRIGIARQRVIQNLFMLAPRQITRKIADLKGEHAVTQALVIHDAMESGEPARAAAFHQSAVEGAVIGFHWSSEAFRVRFHLRLDAG